MPNNYKDNRIQQFPKVSVLPNSSDANFLTLGFKSDGNLYKRDNIGTETLLNTPIPNTYRFD